MQSQISRVMSGGRRRSHAAADDLLLVPISALRPTQMAVGMRSVRLKRRRIETQVAKSKRLEKVLTSRPIPIICGPAGRMFIIDHHHFGLALWQAEVEAAYVRIIDDKSHLSAGAFWQCMEANGRLYPFDEEGQRVEPERLPRSLHALRHDPFRDLAWQVREAGGFQKSRVPYAEFRWANLFRQHIDACDAIDGDKAAFKRAMRLCRSRAAAELPGYIGLH
jgi:hypothetical protein